MFECPLGDYVYKENYTYVNLTTTTLSRRLTMRLNDSSSNSIPKSKFRKIQLENTIIIAYEINKLRLESLYIKTKNLKSIELIL